MLPKITKMNVFGEGLALQGCRDQRRSIDQKEEIYFLPYSDFLPILLINFGYYLAYYGGIFSPDPNLR